MNVPAIAQKTFDLLKNEMLAIEIVQLVLKKLGKLHDPVKRARFVHRLVDEASSIPFSSSTVKELSPCKKGCSACCHTQVSVTRDEAKVLAIIYEDRPSVCRTNVVLGSADQCDTKDEIKPTRLVKTHEADLVVYAAFLHSEDSGTLSYMLAKGLGLLDS